jgi:hypothetical protein
MARGQHRSSTAEFIILKGFKTLRFLDCLLFLYIFFGIKHQGRYLSSPVDGWLGLTLCSAMQLYLINNNYVIELIRASEI